MGGYGMDVCLRQEAKSKVAFLTDMKTELAESWQAICPAAAKNPI